MHPLQNKKKQDLWRPSLKETHRESNEKHNTDLGFPWVCLLLNTKEPITTSITVASPAAFVLKPDELYWFGKIVQLLGKLDSSLFTTIYFFLMKRQLVNIQLTGQLKASLAAFLFPCFHSNSLPPSTRYNELHCVNRQCGSVAKEPCS